VNLKLFLPFTITLTTCWAAILLLWAYLEASCLANAACSGEYGVVFVLMGSPWSMLLVTNFEFLPLSLSIWLSIFINTAIIGAIVQGLFLFIKKLKG